MGVPENKKCFAPMATRPLLPPIDLEGMVADGAPDEYFQCAIDRLSAQQIRLMHEQMLRNWTQLTRTSVLANGIPAGVYCLERIRREKRYRRDYEKHRHGSPKTQQNEP